MAPSGQQGGGSVPIIAVANQKGGVGKTTSTLNLGAALQEAGKRVLLVDLDPQGNLSVAAGIVDIDAAHPSIGDLLGLAARGRAASGPGIAGAVVHTPSGLDIVPANAALSAAELGLVSAMNRESMLAGLLKSVEANYDYILIDCLPSLGLLAINALRAAHGVVIPVQADFLAMQGLRRGARAAQPRPEHLRRAADARRPADRPLARRGEDGALESGESGQRLRDRGAAPRGAEGDGQGWTQHP
ncbi:MAG: ParA family protein [Chloroflexi bacterium]|nr:MAG: ParA family protein [Chloroflexota bacterium]